MAEDDYTTEFVNDPDPWPLTRIDRVRPTEDVPLPADDIPKKPLRLSHLPAEDVAKVIDALGPTSPDQADRVLEVVNTLVRDAIKHYEDAITWDTTCLNCSNLLDQLYAADNKVEVMREQIEDVVKDRYHGDFSPILPKLQRIARRAE